MNYKIEEKGAFRVFGKEEIIDSTNENNFIQIPKFWEKCQRDGTIDRFWNLDMPEDKSNLGKTNSIMCYRCTGDNTFPYMIGIVDFDGSAVVPEDLSVVDVKPYNWAIFRTENHGMEDASEKIQAVWKRVFPEWFPTSGYEYDDGPELELTYCISDTEFYTEVWIPVVKK